MKFEYSDHYLVPCAVEKVERNHGNKRVSQVRTPLAANVANQREFVIIHPILYIAAVVVKYCLTTPAVGGSAYKLIYIV